MKRHGIVRAVQMLPGGIERAVARWRSPPERSEFDRVHGVDTDGEIPLWKLETEGTSYLHGSRYEGTPVSLVREALRAIPIRHEDFTFIDIGSGKGRVLLIAAELPFRAVLGVELVRALHLIAEKNFERYVGARRCNDVRSLFGDAAQFDFPDEPCVVYFFNPFDASVFRRVVANLRESHAASPRDIYVLYVNHELGGLFEEAGFSLLMRGGDRETPFAAYVKRGVSE